VRVLVVDDEENVRKGLATFLGLSGHEAETAADLAGAREKLASERFDVALVDVYVGAENGAGLLEAAAASRGSPRVLMMSGKGSVRDAVDAVRRGAYDFFEKPLDTDRLLAALRNVEREAAAEGRLEALRGSWLAEHVYLEPGSALAAAFEEAARAAASPLSILVAGPTGSGKELAAKWIHLSSPRSRGPFVAVNCAAVPEELAESEFFGSRKGAFTGSASDRQGYFEAASGGTLFLDEVGELPLALQASLLRAVELGEIRRVGDTESRRVDLRLVSATNRDLRSEIAAGRFREDLYWRLAQSSVALPSLEARRREIRGLSLFLAAPIRERMGDHAPELGEEALGYLEARPWPGNVRELRAFIERALWLAPQGRALERGFLQAIDGKSESPAATDNPAGEGKDGFVASGMSLSEAKAAFERAYLRAALDKSGGSVAEAAAKLGLLPNNLSRRLKELGIRRI
jgi:two-component system, NtrC family, nitrogen regulation response regulator NtrX